jgi:hypothetical protein
MPVSVARKLQALRDLLYPHLNIRLYPVALTLEQVRQLNLPSTPLKETEARASRWREVMGHEQTEIDALAALNPDALTTIAREAIRPYYDPSLAERTARAEHDWQAECENLLAMEPAYTTLREKVTLSLAQLAEQSQELARLQQEAAALVAEIEPPPIELPDAENATPAPEALFDSQTDFASASRRLRQYKRLTNEIED